MTSPFTAGNNSSGARDFFPGMVVLNTYEVRDLLGRGGMGAVYRVYHRYLQKDMAMKTLRAEQVASRSWLRFQAEAKAIAKLEHPNIIQIFDMGVCENGQPFYTMELLNGMGLDDWTKHNPISITQTLFVFRQVACGLAFAHERGIIHRDVKPANIVLTFAAANQSPVVKLVDFGIAKLLTEAQGLTKEGEVFGSPLYISPEQATGLKVDLRSDIYSLGCALYETLTGFPPFRGKTAMETMMMHLDKLAVPIERARPEVNYPAGLSLVLQKCMAKQPEARYENASKLAQDLLSIEQGRGEEVAVRLRLEPDFSRKAASSSSSSSFVNALSIAGEGVSATGARESELEIQENIDEQEEQICEEAEESRVFKKKGFALLVGLVAVLLIGVVVVGSFLLGGQGHKETGIELQKKLYDSKEYFRLSKSEYLELRLDEPYDSEFVYYLFPENGDKSIGYVSNISGLPGNATVRYWPASGLVKLPNKQHKKICLGIKLANGKDLDFASFNKFSREEVVYVAFPDAGENKKKCVFKWETQAKEPSAKVLNMLEQLRIHFPALYQIDTAYAPLDNACLEKIEKFERMQKLELADSHFPDDASLEPLQKINNYDVLLLPACSNISLLLKRLDENNKLKVLGLRDFKAKPDEIAVFDKLSRLTTFSCSHSRISNELLLKLKGLPELSELNLSGSSLEAGALPILLEMRHLKTLSLAGDIRSFFPADTFNTFDTTLKQRNCQLILKKNCASLKEEMPESF